jgi:hypothetical protein
MMAMKCGLITGSIVEHTQVFETGVFFWGSFVGCLSMLILSAGYLNDTDEHTLLMQMLMCGHCLIMLYFGTILHISSYKSIGGTFFVLWCMNIERILFIRVKSFNKTILCGITLFNLYVIKQLISWYPEYCIF